MTPSASNLTSAMHTRFITFEGGEGAGKSTQVQKLVTHLQAQGFDVVATREPGGSPHAEELRNLLLNGMIAPFGAKAEALMFAAARIDHIDTLIKPTLARGAFVICDRFMDSTRAYQGAFGRVDEDFLTQLEKMTLADLRPALTFILDVPPKIGLARADARRQNGAVDRFEGENINFHIALQKAFHLIAQREPERCVLINGERTQEDIAQEIWAFVAQRFHLPVEAT